MNILIRASFKHSFKLTGVFLVNLASFLGTLGDDGDISTRFGSETWAQRIPTRTSVVIRILATSGWARSVNVTRSVWNGLIS
jgi:hypothetical protein